MSDKARIQTGYARTSDIAPDYGCLVDLVRDKKGVAFAFKRLVWFPKAICTYEVIPSIDPKKAMPTYFITAPTWFLEKKEVPYTPEQIV